MPESLQHKLDRVRPPRVQITYDVEIGGAISEEVKVVHFFNIAPPISTSYVICTRGGRTRPVVLKTFWHDLFLTLWRVDDNAIT